MYRIVSMNGVLYGTRINSVADDSMNIHTFIEEANIVILADDLEDVAEMFEIDETDIVVA